MAEFEEKLNQILSSPSAMEQIMALAGSLSGETGAKEPEQTAPPSPSPMAGLGDLFSGIDPGMIMKLLPLLSQLQDQGDEKTRLLEAMKPFLAPDRQSKLDQAVRIARLSRLIRSAITIFQEEGHV